MAENSLTVFKTDLERLAGNEKDGLPVLLKAYPNITVERFVRSALTAAQEAPDVATADRRSLMVACLKLASVGLIPDGREATIVVRKKKVNGNYVKVAVATPMYYGVVKSLKESGTIVNCVVDIVREGDQFTYGVENGKSWVQFTPQPFGKGEPIGAFAVFTQPDGNLIVEAMDKEQIEAVKASSDSAGSPYSPWSKFPLEMWKKTVVRRGAKRIPVIYDRAQTVLDADNEAHGLVVETTAEESGDAPRADAAPAKGPSKSRMDDIEESISDDDGEPPFDLETGEVYETEASDVDENGELAV